MIFTALFLGLAMSAGLQAQQQQQPGPAGLQPATASSKGSLLEITLERKRDGKVETMSPEHVFQTGDVVRLRLRSHYRGFLYVMDQGTSGHFTTVFPAADTGGDNRIESEHEYLVPAVDEGWFEVQGPAGFDVLYFLLSPAELARPAGNFTAPGPLSSLRPRCNDKVFRARGECMDDRAGPAAAPSQKALPAEIRPLAGSASRDIIFTKNGEGSVGVSGATTGPLIYTFRLAHTDAAAAR